VIGIRDITFCGGIGDSDKDRDSITDRVPVHI
jgi:hypothetical protein